MLRASRRETGPAIGEYATWPAIGFGLSNVPQGMQGQEPRGADTRQLVSSTPLDMSDAPELQRTAEGFGPPPMPPGHVAEQSTRAPPCPANVDPADIDMHIDLSAPHAAGINPCIHDSRRANREAQLDRWVSGAHVQAQSRQPQVSGTCRSLDEQIGAAGGPRPHRTLSSRRRRAEDALDLHVAGVGGADLGLPGMQDQTEAQFQQLVERCAARAAQQNRASTAASNEENNEENEELSYFLSLTESGSYSQSTSGQSKSVALTKPRPTKRFQLSTGAASQLHASARQLDASGVQRGLGGNVFGVTGMPGAHLSVDLNGPGAIQVPGARGSEQAVAVVRRDLFREAFCGVPCSETDLVLLGKLMDAAEALESSNLPAFRETFRCLTQFANAQGRAIPRVLHFYLHGLLLRCTGLGYSAFNNPASIPFEVTTRARIWFHKHTPISRLCEVAALGTVSALLSGIPRVHILEFGCLMVPQWPAVFRHLAQQMRQRNATCHPVHVRLTFVDSHNLIHPGRSDLKLLTEGNQIEMWLRQAAQEAGIILQFEQICLDRQNLPELTNLVVPSSEDALVVVGGFDFDNFLDKSVLEFGIRETILEWIGNLQPLAFAMVGVPSDSNDLPFLDRMRNMLQYSVACFTALEKAADKTQGWEHLLVIEHLFASRHILNTIACEGTERVYRCQSLERWRLCMQSCGLRPGPLCGVDAAHDLLSGYPDGYGIQVDHGSLSVTFQGTPLMALSLWVPQRRIPLARVT